jgi:hypothetical protein
MEVQEQIHTCTPAHLTERGVMVYLRTLISKVKLPVRREQNQESNVPYMQEMTLVGVS